MFICIILIINAWLLRFFFVAVEEIQWCVRSAERITVMTGSAVTDVCNFFMQAALVWTLQQPFGKTFIVISW